MPRRMRSTLATLVLTTLLAGGTSLALPGPAAAALWRVRQPDSSLAPLTHLTEYENRVVHLVNERRAHAGLHRVRWFGSCIDGFSERWAGHLAATGAFVHRDQHQILDRCGMTWAGETLVRGTAITPRQVVRAWMRSPGHRAVLMKPRANRAGVGVRIDGQGRVIGVLNFGDTN